MLVVAVGLTLFMMASTSMPVLEPYSVLLRFVGAAVLMAPIVWRRRLGTRNTGLSLGRAWPLIGLGFGQYVLASRYLHGDVWGAAAAMLAFLLVSLLLFGLVNYYDSQQVVRGTSVALFFVCVSSLVFGRVRPDLALENERLRGIFENANGLGFTAFALGVVAISAAKSHRLAVLAISMAAACIFFSGSRASALAFIIYLLAASLMGIRRAQHCLIALFAVLFIAWLSVPEAITNFTLFRTVDSRSSGYEVMKRSLETSFWTGIGEMPAGMLVAGSVFAAAITGGALGLAGLLLMYFGYLQKGLTSGPRGVALTVAGCVHSLFESWMLSFSAPLLVTFFVVLAGSVMLDSESARDSAAAG